MRLLLIFVLFLACLSSCSSEQNKREPVDRDVSEKSRIKPILSSINKDSIVKTFQNWYDYHYFNIKLSQPFNAFDVDSTSINKTVFLNKLKTGDFVAFKMAAVNDTPIYKLYRPAYLEQTIRSTLIQLSESELKNYDREGEPFPNYSFEDINGRVYTSLSSRGKIIWVKCWFINCVACVKEFPELNKIVDAHKSDSNMLFISLALDSKEQLQVFLKQRPFKFEVIPLQGDFMSNRLKLQMYPTHFLIDRDGVIIKVTNTEKEMLPFFVKAIKEL
jgi:thiol-disulfide isomerase/thioredoxin